MQIYFFSSYLYLPLPEEAQHHLFHQCLMIFYRDTGAKTQYVHTSSLYFSESLFYNRSIFHREIGQKKWDENFPNDKRYHISVLAWTQKSIPFSAMLWGCVWDISACLFTLWTWKSSSVCSFFITVLSWSRKSLLLNKHEARTDWN